MNEDITGPGHEGSDQASKASAVHVTGLDKASSQPFARDRDARRREKIREELVREHFSQEEIDREQRKSPTPRNFLLRLFKLN